MFLLSRSPSETIRIGKRIGSLLSTGDVVALTGELGAGKTQLVKGLTAGVGIKKSAYISSPSFTLINEYAGSIPFYHIDLYRLTEKETEEIGLQEYFQSEGITAIEWAEKVSSLLPEEVLWIRVDYMGKNTRKIEITGKGLRYEGLVNKLRESLVVNCELRIAN